MRRSSEQAPDAEDRDVPILQQAREEEIEHDDRDEAGDEAFGASAPDAGGAAAAGESLVTTDQPNRAAEEERFENAFDDLPGVDAHGGVLPVGLVGDAEGFCGNEPAAE